MSARDDCLALAKRFQQNPEAVVDWWAERAAIREFEGGQEREEAERDALKDVEMALEAGRRGPKAAQAPRAAKRKAE